MPAIRLYLPRAPELLLDHRADTPAMEGPWENKTDISFVPCGCVQSNSGGASMNHLTNLHRLLFEANGYSAVIRLVLAVLLGGCIGSERGRHGRAAGLRTHILVSVGACMTALVGLYTATALGFQNDPMRVSAQVVSGIGFLCAGTILTGKHAKITGLTTAAGLWTTANIGIAVGIGFYSAAIAAFVVTVIAINVLPAIEKAKKLPPADSFYVELDTTARVNLFYDELQTLNTEVQLVPAYSSINGHIGVEITIKGCKDPPEAFLNYLRGMEGVEIAIPLPHGASRTKGL